MALEIVTLPCLSDNYSYLIHDADTGATAVVDVPDAPPVLTALKSRGWTLTDVLLTHHHWDHIDGLPALLDGLQTRPQTGPRIWGAAADAHRLPPLDHALTEGDTPQICGELVQILDMPGHTLGHIAYHFSAAKLLFSGDSIMVMGCGRLFEGTPAQMWNSFCKTNDMPGETLLYSGHEYTASNIRFARSLEPENQDLILLERQTATARAANKPTVPSTLAQDRKTNPFLRAADPTLKAAIGMFDAPSVDCFTEIRARKDNF